MEASSPRLVVRINGRLEKWIYLLMPAFLLAGLAAGPGIGQYQHLTPYLFMAITFLSALTADFRLLPSLLRKPGLLAAFLLTAHLLAPLAIYGAARIVFASEPDLAAGAALAMLLPLGVTSIFWVSFNRGNMALILSLVTLDTLLSPLLVPFAMKSVLGSAIELNTSSLIWGLVKLVVIPAVLGMAAGELMRRTKRSDRVLPHASLAGKLALFGVVALNAAAIREPLGEIGLQAAAAIAFVGGAMLAGYCISYALGKFYFKDASSVVSVSYAGGVRNYTVGVVLASAYFTPLTTLPILLAMLLQHPMAMLIYYLFRRGSGRRSPGTVVAGKSASS